MNYYRIHKTPSN